MFISYRRPMRSARVLRQIVATFGVSVVAFLVAVVRLDSAPIAGLSILVGMVAFIIGCVLLWSFALRRVHEIQVTDQGISCDGRFWSWGCVTSIQSTYFQSNDSGYLTASVNRGRYYLPLSLLIEIESGNGRLRIGQLQDFLSSNRYPIRWRTRAC